jgi:hypothetical protein
MRRQVLSLIKHLFKILGFHGLVFFFLFWSFGQTSIGSASGNWLRNCLCQDIYPHMAMSSTNAISLKISQIEGEDFGCA